MVQDTTQIKQKILSILKQKGPSLPVHIAKEIDMSILFTSAFLSELASENKIKISNMKVGGSPVYFLPRQEPQLENFSQHLKSKEKDAFILLKQKKFLRDKNQEPAIRVALRAIRDFAIPFRKNDEIFWRYLTVPESEFVKKISKKEKKELIKVPIRVGRDSEEKLNRPKLNIFDEKPKKKIKKRIPAKKHDKFFNKIKEFLSERNIEILDIQDFSKSEITLLVKENNQEKLLVAYNKKRITENDIIKTNQKAEKQNLKYIITSKGEPLKKTSNLIKAAKNLSKIEKLE